MADAPSQVTSLLGQWSDGDPAALDKLLPLVVGEVRDLAPRALALNPAAEICGGADTVASGVA